jgi:two-component system, OmpR family, response regulator MprA
MHRARVLLVGDEAFVRSTLRRALTHEGYDVDAADSKHVANGLTTTLPAPDIVVLHVLIPGPEIIEVTHRLRAAEIEFPILVVAPWAEGDDAVAGLDAGADDYLVRPFALEELLARIRALLRRTPAEPPDVLRFADLELDSRAWEARRSGRWMELTRTEFALLELLMRNPGKVLTRSTIIARVWGDGFRNWSNSLEVYIGHLRRKTEAGGKRRLIQTVRGVGYALREA